MRINQAPSHYVVKDGKLQPKFESDLKSSSPRVISYEYSPRFISGDSTLIKTLQQELEKWKKDYGELQRAYWHLLGAKSETHHSNPQFKKNDILHQTALSISEIIFSCSKEELTPHISESMVYELQTTKSRLKQLTASSITSLEDKHNLSRLVTHEEESFIQDEENNQQDQDQFFDKLQEAFDQIENLKEQLAEAENTSYDFKKINEQNSELEKTVKKLQQILQREKRNSRMLNQMIGRMRNDLNNRDEIIRQIVELKKIDKGSIQKIVGRCEVHKKS